MSFCSQRLTAKETLSTVKFTICILFQEIACLPLVTIYVFVMRHGPWLSWQCIRSPILWRSLVAAGCSGRHVRSHFTEWPIRSSTRRWWSRWPGAAMATFKSVVTVPCVSLLHNIVPSVGWEIIKERMLFCLFSDFKSDCTSVLKSDDSYRQTSIQHDLAVCGAVYKIPDGSTETAHLQISRC